MRFSIHKNAENENLGKIVSGGILDIQLPVYLLLQDLHKQDVLCAKLFASENIYKVLKCTKQTLPTMICLFSYRAISRAPLASLLTAKKQ